MTADPLFDIRFGYGPGPEAAPATPTDLLAGLSAPDRAASRYPVGSLAEALVLGQTLRLANRDAEAGVAGAEGRYDTARAELRRMAGLGIRAAFARIADTSSALRERLMWFWADHFTAHGTNLATRAVAPSYVDEAIRPHVTGRFGDMLRAVVRHPMMLFYLDQHVSVGPTSPAAARTGRGLNENLARELLELHTLGVGGGYVQADVRAAAELLTGLGIDPAQGFVFRPLAAEPGPETILGRSYGTGSAARLADIDAFLDDLALTPQTARHLASKLATHFVADAPPGELVEDLAQVYAATGGDLMALTQALVSHPLAARPVLAKVRPPMEFVGAAIVALGLTGDEIWAMPPADLRRFLAQPLAAMGQPFLRASGPDGWPEDAASWITPQALATRISWAAAVSDRLGPRAGDPRALLERTLGGLAGDALRFAVSAAETRAEGVALLLASAEFNRR